MKCQHRTPVEYGASQVAWRLDGTGILIETCSECGEYIEWDVQEY